MLFRGGAEGTGKVGVQKRLCMIVEGPAAVVSQPNTGEGPQGAPLRIFSSISRQDVWRVPQRLFNANISADEEQERAHKPECCM